MYDDFSVAIDRHGDKMVSSLNGVVAYELIDEDKRIVIDMKNSRGRVYTTDTS